MVTTMSLSAAGFCLAPGHHRSASRIRISTGRCLTIGAFIALVDPNKGLQDFHIIVTDVVYIVPCLLHSLGSTDKGNIGVMQEEAAG